MTIETSITAAGNALVVNQQPKNTARHNDAVRPVNSEQERTTPAAPIVLRKGNAEAFERADQYRDQQAETYREFSNGRSRDAIEAYQSLIFDAKKAEVSQMMGVDTYV